MANNSTTNLLDILSSVPARPGLGVFQITPRNSSLASAEGINDDTSRENTIRAFVSASFAME